MTSTEDKHYDSSKGITGNPILCTFVSSPGGGPVTVYNNSHDFFSVSIPSYFLQKQFIEFTIEAPLATSSVTLATFQNSFFMTLKIIDVDPELSED